MCVAVCARRSQVVLVVCSIFCVCGLLVGRIGVACSLIMCLVNMLLVMAIVCFGVFGELFIERLFYLSGAVSVLLLCA